MMKWFWDAYTANPAQRREITPRAAGDARAVEGPAARAGADAEKDVLRDEGEAYARKLDAAA